MVDRYIITGAQKGATVHKGFETAMNAYAQSIGAQVIVAPMNGAYKDEELHPHIAQNPDYFIGNQYDFNSNFELADVPVRSQQIRPTTGLSRFVQHNKSAVVAAPKQHLECRPTSNVELPKILTTTGAMTKPNYKLHTRIGNIANRDHTLGALIVEVDGDLFQYRHITADTRGNFHDIDKRVDADGTISDSRPDALILGDWHTGQTDPMVRDVSYDMISALQPKYLILHDIFDGYSISHHEQNQLMNRARKADDGKLNLTAELQEVGAELDNFYQLLSEDAKMIIVKSNHDEVIDRYLQEARFAQDPENYYLSCKLGMAKVEGRDPLQEGIEHVHGSFGKYAKWLGRDEDFKVRGWQLGAHGDLGGNGSRGSLTQQQDNYGKSIVGHRHTPSIRGDAWCVGTSTTLKVDYNRGPSSWMQTHALLHPNGKPQLINILDNRYRF